jgi:hypothetical protein
MQKMRKLMEGQTKGVEALCDDFVENATKALR